MYGKSDLNGENTMSERHLILDTGVLISHLRNIPGVKQLLLRLAQRFILSISAVTVVEIWQGAKPDEVESTKKFLQGFKLISLNGELAEKSGKLLAELKYKGFTIDFADAVIASTARQLESPVLTTNSKHFLAIPELEVWKLTELIAKNQ